MSLSSTRYRIAALFLLAISAQPQSGRAELFAIRDASSRALTGATAELREDQTGAHYQALSDRDGVYHFAALPPGSYTLAVHKPGFVSLRRSGIALGVGPRTALDLTLQIGDLKQTVDVTASAPLPETTTGAVSFLVDGATTSTLPVDGRNFVPLLALEPGVMLPPGQLLPRVNGSRQHPAPRPAQWQFRLARLRRHQDCRRPALIRVCR